MLFAVGSVRGRNTSTHFCDTIGACNRAQYNSSDRSTEYLIISYASAKRRLLMDMSLLIVLQTDQSCAIHIHRLPALTRSSFHLIYKLDIHKAKVNRYLGCNDTILGPIFAFHQARLRTNVGLLFIK